MNSNYDGAIKRVGRTIAKQKITLIADGPNYREDWKAYSIDLSEMIDVDPGSIYRVELNFNRNQTKYTCTNSTSKDVFDDAFTEMQEDEKSSFSHRANALNIMAETLFLPSI